MGFRENKSRLRSQSISTTEKTNSFSPDPATCLSGMSSIPKIEDIPLPPPNVLDVAHNTAVLALTFVSSVATVTPVPHLKEAASAVLWILNTIQNVKDSKGDFKRLAQDAFDVVYAVAELTKDSNSKIAKYTEHVAELKTTMIAIANFGDKMTQRKLLTRIIYSSADGKKVAEFRERLDYAMQLFGLKSHINIHSMMEQMAGKQQEILDELRLAREHREQEARERAARPEREAELPQLYLPDAAPSTPSPAQSPQDDMFGGAFANIRSTSGSITFTKVGGNYSSVDNSNSVTNTNSGNTTVSNTVNSNNDNSVRVQRGPVNRRAQHS